MCIDACNFYLVRIEFAPRFFERTTDEHDIEPAHILF